MWSNRLFYVLGSVVCAVVAVCACEVPSIPVETFVLAYDANGGTGEPPAAAEFEAGTSVSPSDPVGLTRPTYEFVGWNSKPDGTGVDFEVGEVYEMPEEDLTLYARWTLRTVVLGGTLTHAGEPYTGSAQSTAVSIYNVDADEWLYSWTADSGVELSYDGITGEYELTGVPDGTIGLRIELLENPPDWPLGGNYVVDDEMVAVDSLSEADRLALDLELDAVIRMLSPYDNSSTDDAIPRVAADYDTHTSPITFTWEAVPGATSYGVLIAKTLSSDHPDWPGMIEVVVDTGVAIGAYTALLDESGPQEHYYLKIEAQKGDDSIGFYAHSYSNGWGTTYTFRIVP